MQAEPAAGFSAAGALGAAALVVATVAAVVLSALVERSGPIRLRHWAEEAGPRLRGLYDATVRFEVFRYLLNLLARLVPLALVVLLASLLREFGWLTGSLIALALVSGLLAMTELLNRFLVARHSEAALRRLTVTYRVLLLAFLPAIVALASAVPEEEAKHSDGEDEEDEASEEEIEAFIRVGTREGILEPGEDDMLWRLMDFGDTHVKSVMTPRIDMVCAPAETELERLADLFMEAKHSRIPLYQGSIDQVVGILHIRDLLEALSSPRHPPARSLANPPYFVPETKRLDELLREFQARRQQMAIAVDEYGGTAGLVTVEDVVEEIVGEIFDEHEALPPPTERLPDGSWRIDGRAPLTTLKEIFGVEFDGSHYETVGGMIFGLLGYVPGPGEAVERSGLRFEVERVEERRIQTVLVERLGPDETAPAPEGGEPA